MPTRGKRPRTQLTRRLESHGRQLSRWALIPGTQLSSDFSLSCSPHGRALRTRLFLVVPMAAAWGLRRRGRRWAALCRCCLASRPGGVVVLPGARNTPKVNAGQGAAKGPSALHSAKMERNRPDMSKIEIGRGEALLGDQSHL